MAADVASKGELIRLEVIVGSSATVLHGQATPAGIAVTIDSTYMHEQNWLHVADPTGCLPFRRQAQVVSDLVRWWGRWPRNSRG